MKPTANIAHLLRRLAIVPIAALGLAGCVVDPPEEVVWEDVGSFGWPTEIGATMHYKVNSRFMGQKELNAEIREGKGEYEGMYRLHTYTADDETTVSTQVHFIPKRDTLLVVNSFTSENGLDAKYALVWPIERGRTWVATYEVDENDRETDSARTIATVIERYSYWKLEGKGYNNVVAVKYTRAVPGDEREEWIRFYAKGVGVILTVKTRYPQSNYPTQAPPQEDDRVVLTESSVAP